jgi:hypothetical protein
MNNNNFNWKNFINNLDLQEYNFNKINNINEFSDEYKKIAFLSYSFNNWNDSCVERKNNQNNLKKKQCSNFSDILLNCERNKEFYGTETKTYNCEKFLLLLRSPILEPCFLIETPELLINRNFDESFKFDFKNEFKKIGFYDILFNENNIQQNQNLTEIQNWYNNNEISNINNLSEFVFKITNSYISQEDIQKLNQKDNSIQENEIINENNTNEINLFKQGFDEYVKNYINQSGGSMILNLFKKTIHRLTSFVLLSLFYFLNIVAAQVVFMMTAGFGLFPYLVTRIQYSNFFIRPGYALRYALWKGDLKYFFKYFKLVSIIILTIYLIEINLEGNTIKNLIYDINNNTNTNKKILEIKKSNLLDYLNLNNFSNSNINDNSKNPTSEELDYLKKIINENLDELDYLNKLFI